MDLWVLLDEYGLDKKISSGFVFTNNTNHMVNVSKENIIMAKSNVCDEDYRCGDSVRHLLKLLGAQYKCMENTLYMQSFRTVFSYCRQVMSIVLEKQITKVCMVGGSSKIFLTTIHGEGEGVKKIYKTSWLVNPILYHFLKESKVQIIWKSKLPTWLTECINFVREFFFLGVSGLKEIRRHYIYRRKAMQCDIYTPDICVVAQLSLQYNHLAKLLNQINNHTVAFLCFPYVKTDDSNINFLLTFQSVNKVLRIIRKILANRTSGKNAVLKYENITIKIKQNKIKRALLSNFLLYECQVASIRQAIRQFKNARFLVTDMTFGELVFGCHKMAEEMKIKHINFQYVSMSRMLFPCMDLADDYYLYSKKTYSLYAPLSNSFKLYFPNFGKYKKNKCNQKLNVSVFLQPEIYADLYSSFLDEFCLMIEAQGLRISLLIKPHYRQNKIELFQHLADKYSFVELLRKDEIADKVLEKSNIMMSMSSSVLFEAVTYNVMGIIIDSNNYNYEFMKKNDVCVQEVNFYAADAKEALKYITDFNRYLDLYTKRRQIFISQYELADDVSKAFK